MKIIIQTHLANAFPTDGRTTLPPPPNVVFLVDDEVATLAARGEKANALAEVATSASRANFFMMMAIVLFIGCKLVVIVRGCVQHQLKKSLLR